MDFAHSLIYIPLWYLLIQNRLNLLRGMTLIYIPLWYLLIHTAVPSPWKLNVIYIPLWYLLIRYIGYNQLSLLNIYIPLWYLLIPTKSSRMICRALNLHSTMVSINLPRWPRISLPHQNLHSTMVSINPGGPHPRGNARDIYIPLWYLLIKLELEQSRTFLYIYIPLWYLLILSTAKTAL